MIVRTHYLNTLKNYRDVPLVKILAGIRRSGKSTILDMLKDDLIGSGISADHVIYMRYTSEELDDNITDKQMYCEIKDKMTDSQRYYLLLDEVQEVDGWEKAVNSLLEDCNTDIYVTGSNSKLMSGEISTYLTGRYISIPVFTLSFAEYLEFKKESGRTHNMFQIVVSLLANAVITIDDLKDFSDEFTEAVNFCIKNITSK